MPKHLFEQASITLNGQNISGDVSGAEFMLGRRGAVDVTGLSDTFDSYLVPNLRRWGVKLDFFNNFSSSGVYQILKGVFQSTQTSGVALVVRVTTNDRSSDNPEWTGQVQIDGDFAILAGGVAEADKGSVSLKGLSTLTFVTSSSS